MKQLFIACILSFFAVSAWCEPTAKAVWDANAKTFTFYYDETTYSGDGITQYGIPTTDAWNTTTDWAGNADLKTSVTNAVFDASFANYKPANLNNWFSGFSKLEKIEHLDYLDTSKAGYANYMFNGCSSLTSLDLSHFTTSTKMCFREFFRGCSNIEVLDLTAFTNVKDTRSMFNGMTKLKTIYVTEQFVIDMTGSKDDKEFSECSALVGGAGTAYATAKVATRDYARIDDPEHGAPGYFTLGQKPVPPVIASVTVWGLTYNSVTIVVEGETLNDGTITVELVADGVTEKTDVLTAFDAIAFSDLTPETAYTVKVTATSKYGTTINTDCAFATPAQPADYWLYDSSEGSVSWSEWKFNAILAKDGTIKIGAVTHWPDAAMALDFSRPVKDGDGTVYVISDLSPTFGHQDSASGFKPAGYEPQCLRVGLLTLPGEGLLTIGIAAFAACANASGVVVFPSTLTSIGSSAFADCTSLRIDGSTIPGGVTEIPQYCFKGDKEMFGDVVMTNVTKVADSAFQSTAITSAAFGPNLKVIGGNYERGAFQGCKSLTNLVFDAASTARISDTFVFNNCSALEELNLCGVVNFSLSTDRNDYSHISGCSSLKKITFGAALTNLAYNAMAGATALEEVVFEGVPPVVFGLPYLSATNSKGEHVATYDSKTITTYVHRNLIDTPNEAGRCWTDYAVDGKIAAEKTTGNTTFAADYVYAGIDLAKRPLVTIESGSRSGMVILYR